METILYALAFAGAVLLALAIHEAGHLIAAKAARMRILKYKVGLGPEIAGFQTGNITVMPEGGISLPPIAKGKRVILLLQDQPDGELRLKDWRSSEQESSLDRKDWERGATIEAVVRDYTPEGGVEIAHMRWALGLIPFGASVTVSNYRGIGGNERHYNRSRLSLRLSVALAGVTANLILGIGAAFGLASLPYAVAERENQAVLVLEVQPETPADQSGIRAGDLIQMNAEELNQEIAKAHLEGEAVILPMKELESGNLWEAEVYPNAAEGKIGIAYSIVILEGAETASYQEGVVREDGNGIFARVARMGRAYGSGLAEITEGRGRTAEGEVAVTGLIGAGHASVKLMDGQFLQVWLAVTAIISLSMAAVNLLPVPPLDGYMTLKAFLDPRKETVLRERIDRGMEFAGIALLAILTLYVTWQDIKQLATGA